MRRQAAKDETTTGSAHLPVDNRSDSHDVRSTSQCQDQSQRQGQGQVQGCVEIPRTIGFVGAVSFIIGSIIGSGVFISPNIVAAGAGSVGFSLFIWLIIGLVAMCGGLTYAELGTVVGASGADYSILKAAYGPLPAYLFAWIYVVLLSPAGLATQSLTSATYLLTPLFVNDSCGPPPTLIVKLLASVMLPINIRSVHLATRMQVIFTAGKLLAMAFIIVGGMIKLAQGLTGNIATGFAGTIDKPLQLINAFYSATWAYTGWSAVNAICEDVKRPERNLPLSIVCGVSIVIVVYLWINVSYFIVLPLKTLVATPAVAAMWARHVVPQAEWLIPIFVAMSTFGSTNGNLFQSTRLFSVAAREGHMPRVYSMVHHAYYTSIPACITTVLIALVFICAGEVKRLIGFIGFVRSLIFAACALGVIVLRHRENYKDKRRPLRVPLVIPVLFALINVVVFVVTIILDPRIEYLFAIGFICAGLVFYVPFLFFNIELKCMPAITKFVQLFLQVAKCRRIED